MKFSARDSDEADYAAELYPNIAAVGSIYGDADGAYVAYLKRAEPSFSVQPYFLWNQPFAPGEGRALPSARTTASRATSTSKSSSGSSSSDDDDSEENAALSQLIGSSFWSTTRLSLLALSIALVMF